MVQEIKIDFCIAGSRIEGLILAPKLAASREKDPGFRSRTSYH